MLALKPVRLGTHADWIAITSEGGDIVSLAADGSLWYWPLENENLMRGSYSGYFEYFGYSMGNGNSLLPPLLDISHKPQFLGNIFGKGN